MDIGFKFKRGQGYGNLEIVYLETALKAMRFDETTRKSMHFGNRREPSADPAQLEIRTMRTEQRRPGSSNQAGERNNERVPRLKSQTKVWGITKEMINGVKSCW